MLESVLNQILQAEAMEQLQAEPYERTDERQGYRNDCYPHKLTTRVGTLTLRAPRLHDGKFSTEMFARYQRSEQALATAMLEVVINDVSTRKVTPITGELCGVQLSKSTVSELFLSLKQRGLREVELIVSDQHTGLAKAIRTHYHGVTWQRCQTHFMRNILDKTPKALKEELYPKLRDIFDAPDLQTALIYSVNHNTINLLRVQSSDLTPQNLGHCLDEKIRANQIYLLSKDEVPAKIKQLLQESLALLKVTPPELKESQAYLNLQRLPDDQKNLTTQGPKHKAAKELVADSLQNPSEPEITYCRKRNKRSTGYVLNTVEARCPSSGLLDTEIRDNNNLMEAFNRGQEIGGRANFRSYYSYYRRTGQREPSFALNLPCLKGLLWFDRPSVCYCG